MRFRRRRLAGLAAGRRTREASTWARARRARWPTGSACSAPAVRVITVGGTNGKGSTVAYLRRDAAPRRATRCGAFTSPHLVRYNERIRIDGVEASDAELLAAFEAIDAARGDISLTFFEYNALAALLVFRARG